MRLEREPRPRCVDADPTVDEILDTFACRDPRCPCNAPRRGREMKTHCPTHRDTHPSLSVSAKNGVTQVHCFAGCAQSATWDEVKRQVLGRRPGAVRRRQPRPAATLGRHTACESSRPKCEPR